MPDDWEAPFPIELRIADASGGELFAGETSTARMKRRRASSSTGSCATTRCPPGTVLLTGTGIVPPDDVTLAPGHVVEIEIAGIGVLTNTVAS